MLPFSSVRQSKRVWTDNNITEDVWNTRSLAVVADHRLPNARVELEHRWKERLISKGSVAAAGGAPASQVTDEVQYDETDK
jgi:hypothetical protein